MLGQAAQHPNAPCSGQSLGAAQGRAVVRRPAARRQASTAGSAALALGPAHGRATPEKLPMENYRAGISMKQNIRPIKK